MKVLFFCLRYGRLRSKARPLHVKKQSEMKSTLTPVAMLYGKSPTQNKHQKKHHKSALMKVLVLLKEVLVSRVRQVGVVLF